jgi:hypothetical protein
MRFLLHLPIMALMVYAIELGDKPKICKRKSAFRPGQAGLGTNDTKIRQRQ